MRCEYGEIESLQYNRSTRDCKGDHCAGLCSTFHYEQILDMIRRVNCVDEAIRESDRVLCCRRQVKCRTVQYCKVECSEVDYNTMQCNTMQCNATQCNSVYCSVFYAFSNKKLGFISQNLCRTLILLSSSPATLLFCRSLLSYELILYFYWQLIVQCRKG